MDQPHSALKSLPSGGSSGRGACQGMWSLFVLALASKGTSDSRGTGQPLVLWGRRLHGSVVSCFWSSLKGACDNVLECFDKTISGKEN